MVVTSLFILRHHFGNLNWGNSAQILFCGFSGLLGYSAVSSIKDLSPAEKTIYLKEVIPILCKTPLFICKKINSRRPHQKYHKAQLSILFKIIMKKIME